MSTMGHKGTYDRLGGDGIESCLAMSQYSHCDLLMTGRGFEDGMVNIMLSELTDFEVEL